MKQCPLPGVLLPSTVPHPPCRPAEPPSRAVLGVLSPPFLIAVPVLFPTHQLRNLSSFSQASLRGGDSLNGRGEVERMP